MRERVGMKVTAFIDVLSHWCLAAVPALEALTATLADDVELDVVIAPTKDGASLGYPAEVEQWYYRRGTLAYGSVLSAAWYEGPQAQTGDANAAALAAIRLGADPVRTVAALSRAAMRDGAMLGRETEAVRVAAQLANVSEDALRETLRSAGVQDALREGNRRLAAAGCGERPSWRFENANGDFAVLQGVWQAEAILPLAGALLADERAYKRAGPAPAF